MEKGEIMKKELLDQQRDIAEAAFNFGYRCAEKGYNIQKARELFNQALGASKPCPRCIGSGRFNGNECPECQGTKRIPPRTIDE